MLKMRSHNSTWEFTCTEEQSLSPEKPLVVPKEKVRLLNNYQQRKLCIVGSMVGLFYCCGLGLTIFPKWFELSIIHIIPIFNPVPGFTGI